MKQALKRYQLETYPTIHLDECNLTGLYGSDYEKFCDTLFEQKKLFGASIDTELPVSTALAFLHQTYEKAKSMSYAMAAMLLIILWLLVFTASLIIWLRGSGIPLQKPVTGRMNG